MADSGKGYFGGPAYVWARATEIGTNEGGNSSTVRVEAWCGVASPSYAEFSASTVTLSIDGQSKVLNTQTYYYYPPYGDDYLGAWDFVIGHNADGSRTVGFSATFPTGIGTGYTAANITLSDFQRLPTAPTTVTAVKSGSNVVVTSSDGSTYEGLPILGYYVSYRSSSNGGSTWGAWSSEQTMTNKSYTYVNPTPGLTYQYRVRVNNSEGYSGYRESSTLFLTAGGKRYDGGQFVLTSTAAKRFDGSSFNSFTIAKRFDGSNWVNLS